LRTTKLLEGEVTLDKKGKRKVKSGESTAQMRYETEVIKSGSKWYSRMDMRNVDEIEIGCMISALTEWSKSPRLGGMHNKGYGLVKAEFNYIDLNTKAKIENFAIVGEQFIELSKIAGDYKKEYDTLLKDVVLPIMEKYNRQISAQTDDMIKMIEGD